MTGLTSGIGAVTASLFRRQDCHVVGSDLHDADVADLTSTDGRVALVRGVSRLAEERIDAVVANAGGGLPETGLSLNFFGAVATLEGLRPLVEDSPAPRAVAVSSIAPLGRTPTEIIEQCLETDEPGAIAAARTAFGHGGLGPSGANSLPDRGRHHSVSTRPPSRPCRTGAEGLRQPENGRAWASPSTWWRSVSMTGLRLHTCS